MADKHKTVVRVTTAAWTDKRGVHLKKSINRLIGRSKGYDLIDNFRESDALDEVALIVNLNEVTDGVYELAVINEQTNWETGYTEAWEYFLKPITN